jgi:hypothetical protein
MIALLGGIAILGGLLLLTYLFVNADPRRLARDLQWVVIVIGVALLIAVVISERLVLLWFPMLLLAFPIWRRLRALRDQRLGLKPEAATRFLRVTRDPKTGTAAGIVLRGTFAGSRLDELARDEQILLLKEARIDDPEGGGLIENYLDHAQPGWRADFAPSADGDLEMSVQEARDILGVEIGADEATITRAYRQLMQRLHSDALGNDYFEEKINRARDVLLKH